MVFRQRVFGATTRRVTESDNLMSVTSRVAALPVLLAVLASSTSHAWNPRPGWRDSYSVDGVCYCDSSNYDHGIGDKTVQTPDGLKRSVQQVCADIKATFGEGAIEGRIPYNTIACGNAPANDAPDEDLVNGCPGRVDRGDAGCFEIGPQWPLAQLYGAPAQLLDRSNWKIAASHQSRNTAAMADGDGATRWTTKQTQQPGQWITVDLAEPALINSLQLDSTGSRQDFPLAWVLEVSDDGVLWTAASDSDSSNYVGGGVALLRFPEVKTQHLRLMLTAASDKFYWSIHEIYIGYRTEAK